jgi:lipopolysaccharide/colanic/teichoic acid biosynthesis glycosyltransferase
VNGRTSAVSEDADAALHASLDSGARSWLFSDVLLRPGLLEHLEREKSRANRSRTPLSIVMCDGRDIQDEVLRNRELAEMLVALKRETDMVGQIGDGLFAVLLPDTGVAGAERFTEKLCAQVRQRCAVRTITRTYPDQLFDALLCGTSTSLDAFPFLEPAGHDRGYDQRIKRAIDVVGALALLVLFAPVMAATALAILSSTRDSVIFRQVRLGRGGVPFVFYKFRSMRSDADDRIHRRYVTSLIDGKLRESDQGDGQRPLYKMKCDPRVTAVGRFIRKTSIDELPQLINVLKGEMSLVGPRPPITYEAERYQPWHLRRILEVKPGITGLWQVIGRSRTTFDEMVRLDIRYIRERSLVLDLKILLKTVYVVLKCDGAN